MAAVKKTNRAGNPLRLGEAHKATLIAYLCNPENPYISRSKLATEVLGLSHAQGMYHIFTPEELAEIEAEALDERRKRYAVKLAAVDTALLERAAGPRGTAADAKLAYQRFEGWTEKQKQEITWDGPVLQQMLALFPPELADRVKTMLISKQKELT